MEQVLVAAAVVAAAVVLAGVLRRRQKTSPPTQPGYRTPAQLDRNDFACPAPWLLAVFSSATCNVCADVKRKAEVLASPQVGVIDVEYGAAGALHTKYAIEAVPLVVLADSAGVVRASFVGPMTATDLWAAVAEVRDPGSTPSGPAGHCRTDQT